MQTSPTPITKHTRIVRETIKWKLLSKRETVRRAGHACAGVPGTPLMYVYGGAKDNIGTALETNQLAMYDYDKGVWRSFTELENETRPGPRIGHKMVGITDGRIIGSEISYQLDKSSQQHLQVRHSALLVFGGWSKVKATNELWKFNCLTNTWHDLTAVQSGNIPSPRTNHACVVIDDKMIVFGGLGEKPDDSFADTYILDLRHLTWKEIPVVGEAGVDYPHKSRSHAYTVHRKRLVLFGGGTDKVCYNSLWAFDLLVERWILIQPHEPKQLRLLKKRQEEQRERQATSLELVAELGVIPTTIFKEPEPRLFCEAVIADVDQLFIFGGRNGKQKINETWRFDFESNEWELLEFGDVNEIHQIIAPSPDEDEDEQTDAEDDTDQKPPTKPRDKPGPRSGCCMATVTGSDGKNKLLMFGGATSKSKSSELWELIVHTNQLRSNILKILDRQVFTDVCFVLQS